MFMKCPVDGHMCFSTITCFQCPDYTKKLEEQHEEIREENVKDNGGKKNEMA